MRSTFVKICGITRSVDAQQAMNFGAGAVGLNFVGGPRKLTAAAAAEILAALPQTAGVAALIHIPDSGGVTGLQTVLASPQITHLQLYGDAAAVRGFGPAVAAISRRVPCKLWPVLRIGSLADILRIADHVEALGYHPDGIVLDTFAADKIGGTGQIFDWTWLAEAAAEGRMDSLPPMILAGGLNAENVGDAVLRVQPWGVDVSSGVETAGEPGIKDALLMERFIQAVRMADEEAVV